MYLVNQFKIVVGAWAISECPGTDGVGPVPSGLNRANFRLDNDPGDQIPQFTGKVLLHIH